MQGLLAERKSFHIPKIGYAFGRRVHPNTENDLIGLIYEAGMEPALWQTVLDGVRRGLGTGLATLMVRDNARGGGRDAGPAMLAMSGAPPHTYKPYGEYYAPRDPRWSHIAVHPVGEAYTDFAAVPDSVFHRTEIYADFFRPNGIGKCCGVVLIRDPNRLCVVTTNLPTGPDFTTVQIATMQRLAPHMARALRVQRQLAQASADASNAYRLLDYVPTAAFTLTRKARLLHMNQAGADLLFNRTDALRLTASGTISPVEHADQTTFLRALSQTLAAQNGKPPPPIFRLEAPGGPLAVMMAPSRPRPLFAGQAEAASVFIADPHRPNRIDPMLLAEEYDLTPAEARVVAALADGLAVEQIAETGGLSRHTVYTQIKRVLAKTGAVSQAQLVGSVLRSLAALKKPLGTRD